MIQPVETHYAGCHFRSRLEARWAVFFDAMGIPWEYEPERFQVSYYGTYLPDFLLPECGTWIEVKGSEAALDLDLLFAAEEHLPDPVGWVNGEIDRTDPKRPAPKLMLLGPIPPPRPGGDFIWTAMHSPGHSFGFYHMARRPWAHRPVWGPDGEDLQNPFRPKSWLNPEWDNFRAYTSDPENLAVIRDVTAFTQRCYTKARSARFEHGQFG